jgi:hypothetical protein
MRKYLVISAVFFALIITMIPVQTSTIGKLTVVPGPVLMKTAGGTTRFNVATTGCATSVPSFTSGTGWLFTGDSMVGGNLLKLTGVDGTISGGKYVNIFGGTNATSVWSIGESGATTITPNVGSVIPLYIDGTATTSGDLIKLKMVDATQTSALYLNCVGNAGAAAVFTVGEDGATNIGSTATTTESLTITNNTATTGDLLTLTADDDALTTGGKYLQCLGDTNHATEVFAISEGGAVVITPTAASVAVDAIAVAGNVLTSGDLISLTADDDALNGGKYINCIGGTSADTAKFTVGEGGNTVIAGTLTVDGASTLTGAVTCASTLTSKRSVNTTALDTETTITMDPATHPCGTVYISAAAGATTVTLGAVGSNAGSSWEFIRSGAGNFVITGPANTLVTNDATTAVVNATTVTYSAAGHIIGSSAKVFCDGTKWYIVNQGATAIAAT